MRLLRICLQACMLARSCDAAITRGTEVVPANGTVFLAKFCFDYDLNRTAGYFNITLRSHESDSHASKGGLNLVLFDDQAESYPKETSAWDKMPCETKLKHARSKFSIQSSTLSSPEGFSLNLGMTEKLRPRWWYVAVADCSGTALQLEYSVHLSNPLHGWQQELSVDHYGVPYLCFFFLMAYGAVAALQLRANAISKASGKTLHPLVRLLTAGVCSGACAMFLFGAHYECYAHDGRGYPAMYLVGKIFQAITKFVIMSIFLLVAQGRCISRALDNDDLWQLFKVLGPFLLFCLALELWGEYAESRKYTTDFVYSTRFGEGLVLIDVGLLAVYAVNLQGSYVTERSPLKRFFYRAWGSLYGAWFFVLPASVLLAKALSPWVRFKVVMAVSNSAHVSAYAALVVGLWPARRRSYFALDAMELVAIDSEDFQCYPPTDGRLLDRQEWVAWKPLPGDPAAMM